MRTTIIGLLLLGLVSLGYAQVEEPTNGEPGNIELEGVTISSLNADYLNRIQDESTPEIVKKLERKAASYDVKQSPIFDGVHEAYEVFFSNSKGRIVATYDNDGRILTSFEKFKNLRLPVAVREMIGKQFPMWKVEGDVYLASYYQEKDCKKFYIIDLSLGEQTQRIRADVAGNLL